MIRLLRAKAAARSLVACPVRRELLVYDLDLFVEHSAGEAIDCHACHAEALAKAGASNNAAQVQFCELARVSARRYGRFAIRGSVDSFTYMSVEDLEAAVSHLSAVEFARFREWFDEFAADQWDRQIEADIVAGRFDAAGKKTDEDFEAGRCTPL